MGTLYYVDSHVDVAMYSLCGLEHAHIGASMQVDNVPYTQQGFILDATMFPIGDEFLINIVATDEEGRSSVYGFTEVVTSDDYGGASMSAVLKVIIPIILILVAAIIYL